MKKLLKYSSVLLLGLMIFSSCSKQKYTTSFAPSKSKVWNKEAKEEIRQNLADQKIEKVDVIKEEAVVTTETKAVSTVEKSIVKPANIDEKIAEQEVLNPSFSKAEAKSMKKEVRKTMFRAVKNSLFHKRPQNESKILYVILALFPILCLISIYLYQGQQISLDFWIDLLLHITVIGEVIYALLVVLDLFSAA